MAGRETGGKYDREMNERALTVAPRKQSRKNAGRQEDWEGGNQGSKEESRQGERGVT